MNRLRYILLLATVVGLTFPLCAQHAFFVGIVTDEYAQPIDNVVITVGEIGLTTVTSETGTFEIKVPAEQQLTLVLQHISYRDTSFTILLKKNQRERQMITLGSLGEQLEIVDVRGLSDDGFTRIDPKLTFKLPSPSGGVESLIKMLPGISSTNELSSQYNVRGGNFDENLVFVNDIQIYRPFLIRSGQQEGLSFVNSDLTGNIKFSAGGFEAQYGDRMSSVLDVEYKHPTKFSGSLSASLLGFSGHAEGNVKDKFTFLVGVRYKSNAYLFRNLDTKGDYKPRFFDGQMLLSYKPVKKLEINLLGNVSINRYLFVPSDRTAVFGSLASSLTRYTVYYEGQEVDKYENYLGALTFKYSANENNVFKFILSSYYAREAETFDIRGEYALKDIEVDLGSSTDDISRELTERGVGTFVRHARNYINSLISAADIRGTHTLPKQNTLSWGVKVQNEVITDQLSEWNFSDSAGYILPVIASTPGQAVPFTDASRVLNINNYVYAKYDPLSTFRFTGFVQDSWKFGHEEGTTFTLNGGIRFHYWTFNNEFTASPRLSLNIKPHWKQDWEFRIKTGMYLQPPFYREMRDAEGLRHKETKSQESYQIILASEYNFLMWRRPFKFTGEVYFKWLNNLISYTTNNMQITYSGINDAVGYATGLDLKLSGEFIKGLESWISLSLMKTKEKIIRDAEGNKITDSKFVRRPTDQIFNINIFFQDHFPTLPQFRVHLNFVFGSGLPYWMPGTFHTDKNYMEGPWYRRVDIGFSYMFFEQSRDRMRNKSKFARAINNFGIYVEVFNLLNTANVSSYDWIKNSDNSYSRVPNYLTSRLINVKLAIDF